MVQRENPTRHVRASLFTGAIAPCGQWDFPGTDRVEVELKRPTPIILI